MEQHTYVFRNKETGEVRRQSSFASNPAARLAGIEVSFRGKLPESWILFEIFDGEERIFVDSE